MARVRSLPNLRALGVFEAAATQHSFTAAAATLGVTQAAVSKTVRLLEQELGCELFVRRGRSVVLTTPGSALLERCRSAFDHLEEGCALIAQGSNVGVSIAANTAVSHYWLAPLLHEFSAQEPGISVRLVTSDRDTDLTSGESDLAVLYGHDQRIGWTQARLFDERLVPVAARSWLEQQDLWGSLPLSATAIAELPILDHELAGAAWTNFGSWLRHAGISDQTQRHRVFSRYTLAVEAMLSGEGVALGSIPLLPAALHGHEVIQLSELTMNTDRGYHLAIRSGSTLCDHGQVLMNWLLDTAHRP